MLNYRRYPSFVRSILLVLCALFFASCSNPGLAVGDRAPDFTLPNAIGGEVSLSDYKEEQPVLLYFHMAVG